MWSVILFALQILYVSTLERKHSSAKINTQQTCSLVSSACQKELWVNLNNGQGQISSSDINDAGQATTTGSNCPTLYEVDASVHGNSFDCSDVGLISTNSATKVLIKAQGDASLFCFLRVLVEDLPNTPTFYWPLQYDFESAVSAVALIPKSGGSTTNLIVFDSSPFGAAFAVQDGQVANTLQLYLEPNNIVTLGGQTFTIAFEFYIVQVQKNRNNRVRFVDFNSGSDGVGGVLDQIYVGISNDARDVLEFGYTDSASGTLWVWQTADGKRLVDRTLYTVVVTFKVSGGLSVWLNGESLALFAVGTIDAPTTGPPSRTRTNQWIGRSFQGTYYAGYISRFRVYSVAFSTTDAWKLHNKRTRPIASCNSIVNLGLSSTLVALSVSQVNAGSTQCGSGSNVNNPLVTLSHNEFTCSSATGNAIIVTQTVTDTNDNQATCTSSVFVNDNAKPTISCKSPTLTFNANGVAVLSVANDLLSSSPADNCATSLTPTSTVNSVSCGFSPSTATLSVSDDNGNVGTCNSIVTVNDVTKPVAHCDTTPTTLFLTPTGDATTSPTVVDVQSLSSDNCAITSRILNPNFFACADVGAQVITYTVADDSNNEATCVRDVIVMDITPPTAGCKNADVTLDTTGTVTFAVSDVEFNSNDACGIKTTSIATSTFACTNVGQNFVIVTAEDNNGALDTCSSTVTVHDTTKPQAFCATGRSVFLDASGNAAIGSDGLAYTHFEGTGTSDACGYTLSLGQNSWSCTDLSATKSFQLTATDPSFNTQTCAGTIAVVDQVPPALACTDVTKNVGATGSSSVTVGEAISSGADACGFGSNVPSFTSIAKDSYTCSDIGDFTFTASWADSSNNVGTCAGKVSVVDTTPPVMACTSTVVEVGVSGTGDFTPNSELLWSRAGSSDFCGLSTAAPTATPNTFSCANAGFTVSVDITAADVHGNLNTCVSSITVEDNTPPTPVCNNQIVDVAGDGIAFITASNVGVGSTDICGLHPTSAFALDKETFGCGDFGDQTVVLSVRDVSGNIATCSATVTVQDSTAPQGTCSSAQLNVGETGSHVITHTDISAAFTDECNVQSYSFTTQSTYTCGDLGTQTASLTVTDNSGNDGSCTSQLTIVDLDDPEPNCRADILTLTIGASSGDTSALVVVNDIGPGRQDACSITAENLFLLDTDPPHAVEQTGNSVNFDCAHRGVNTVTLEVVDQSDNSDTCSAFVLVDDATDPTVSCQGTVVTLALDASGDFVVGATDVIAADDDFCSVADRAVYSPIPTFSCGDIGNPPTTVTAWVTDLGTLTASGVNFVTDGNTATCLASVTVVDSSKPTVECTDVTVQVGDDNYALITFENVRMSITENCAENTGARSLDISEFSCANLGEVSVTLGVEDVNSNTHTCSAAVLVEDSSAPTFVCETSQTVTVGETLSPYTSNPTDVCGVSGVTISPSSFTCDEAYTTQTYVAWTDDASGNSATCSVSVFVSDETPPTASCQAHTVSLHTSTASITTSNINSGSSDNCVTHMSASQTDFNCANVGTVTVTLFVSDYKEDDLDTSGNTAGNMNSCESEVTVVDASAPTVTCTSTSLDVGSGAVTLSASDLVSSSADNCGISSFRASQSSFDCTDADPGQNDRTVTVTAVDTAGLSSTCTAIVMVDDNVDPQITCPATVTISDVDNDPLAAFVDGGVSTTDHCGVSSTTALSSPWTCGSVGTSFETYKVTDDSGNSATCSAVAIVEDNTKPTLNCKSNTNFGLGFDGSVTITVDEIQNAATTDGCAAYLTETLSQEVFSCGNVNNDVFVTVTASDRSNTDTCEVTLSIQDDQLPESTCNTNLLTIDIASKPSSEYAVVEGDFVLGYTDNCGVTSTEIIPGTTYTCDNVTQTVSEFFKVLDAEAEPNTDNGCGSNFIILDQQPPTISVATLTTAFIPSTGSVFQITDQPCTECIEFPSLITDVGCDTDVQGTFTPSSFTCANRYDESFTITVTAQDDWGNSATATTRVWIEDNITPTVNCLTSTEYTLSSAGNFAIVIAELLTSSTDNCGIVDRRLSQSTFTCADRGDVDVVLAVSDFAQIDTSNPSSLALVAGGDGNIAMCTVTVTITDDNIPALQCIASISVEVGNSDMEVTDKTIIQNVEDACDSSVTIDVDDGVGGDQITLTYGCDDVGSVTETTTATDSSGNAVTCTTAVTISDTVAPSIIINDSTPEEELSGTVTLVSNERTTDIYTVIDRCDSTPSVKFSPHLGCVDVYTPTIVTITATDTYLNSVSTTVEITVTDVDAPAATCVSSTVSLSLSNSPSNRDLGTATLGIGQVGSATDNCAVTDTAISEGSYSCADRGEHTVTFHAVDFADVATNADGYYETLASLVVSSPSDSANSATCATVIDVVDSTAPTLTCDTVVAVEQVDAAKAAKGDFTTITLGDVLPDSKMYDNCGIDSTTAVISPSQFSCGDLGEDTLVALTVFDEDGNSATCNHAIALIDSTPPLVTCKVPVIEVGQAISDRTVTALATDFYSDATDFCGVTSRLIDAVIPPAVNQPFIVYTCGDLPSQINENLSATITVKDDYDNSDSCSTMVDLVDTVPPEVNCHSTVRTVLLDNTPWNGTYAASDSDVISLDASDECGILETNISTSHYFCADRGAQINTFTAVDWGYTANECTRNVWVMDSNPPTPDCRTGDFNVGEDKILTMNFTLHNVDNCEVDSITPEEETVSCFNIGQIKTNTITVSDADGNSNTCVSVVTIVDSTDPEVTCTGSTTVEVGSGAQTLTASSFGTTYTDVCGISSTSVDITTLSCGDVDNSPVDITFSIADTSGNTDTCSTAVTVEDTVHPTAGCPTSATMYTVSVTTNGNGPVDADDIATTFGSSDTCGIETATPSISAFTCGDVGIRFVNIEVADPSGNTDTCEATVTVADTEAPVCSAKLNLQPIDVGVKGREFLNVPEIADFSDNCAVATKEITWPDSRINNKVTCEDIGKVTVTVTITDTAGLIGTCDVEIEIVDHTAPQIVCLSGTYNVGENKALDAGKVFISADSLTNKVNSFDHCGIDYSLGEFTNQAHFATENDGTKLLFTCGDIGSPQIIINGFDFEGNSDFCSPVSINIVDSTNPVARCQSSVQLGLNALGQAVASDGVINAGSADVCSITTKITGPNAFNCADLQVRGDTTNSVSLLVTDPGENFDICTSAVTIVDQIPPTVQCSGNVNLPVNAVGTVTLSAASFGVDTSTNVNIADNCGVASATSITHTHFTCGDIGSPAAVELTAMDDSGNAGTCTVTVNIIDDMEPVVTKCVASTIVNLDSLGGATVTAGDIFTVKDNCGISATLGVRPAIDFSTFDCDRVGQTVIVTGTSEDRSGLEVQCTSRVTIDDKIKPEARCEAGIVVVLGQNGIIDVPGTKLDLTTNPSSDNCAIRAYLIEVPHTNPQNKFQQKRTFTCADVRSTPTAIPTKMRVLTNSNGDSNFVQAECQSAVTVLDNQPPTMKCSEYLAYINSQPGQGFVRVSFDDVAGESVDNCQDTVIEEISSDATPDLAAQGSGPSLLFTCADVGKTHILTAKSTDLAGNVAECVRPGRARVTVRDNTPANIVCRSLSDRAIDPVTGILKLSPMDFISTDTSDNCELNPEDFFFRNDDGILRIDDNGNAEFSCKDVKYNEAADSVEPTPITVCVKDMGGSVSCCDKPSTRPTVTVRDSVPPNLGPDKSFCRDSFVIELGEDGTNQITPGMVQQEPITDICGISPNGLTIQPNRGRVNCADAGTTLTTRRLTATDVFKNSVVCEFEVTVQDNMKPVIARCQGEARIAVDDAGAANLDTSEWTEVLGVSDNCHTSDDPPALDVTKTSFSCDHIKAVQAISITAFDRNGNSRVCRDQKVRVVDEIKPRVTCKANPTISLRQLTQNVHIPNVEDVRLTVQDNCGTGDVVETLDPPLLRCADIGRRTVVLTATDFSGNTDSCEAVATITDDEPPTAKCTGNFNTPIDIFLGNTGTVDSPLFGAEELSRDNCGAFTVSVTPSSFGCEHVNQEHRVTVTVTDGSGATDKCIRKVTVRDTLTPQFECKDVPVDIDLDATGSGEVTADDILDSGSVAVDACRIDQRQVTGKRDLQCSDRFSDNFATLLVTDKSGQTSQCEVQVRAIDRLAPVISCKQRTPVRQLNSNGVATFTKDDAEDGRPQDNCDGTINDATLISTDLFRCDAMETQQFLTYEARDASGNRAECKVLVRVRDDEPPTLTCPGSINLNLGADGRANVAEAINLDDFGTDNCRLAPEFSIAGRPEKTYTCLDLPKNTNTAVVKDQVFTIRDSSNNPSTCEIDVRVSESVNAQVICPTVTPQTNARLVLGAGGRFTPKPEDFFITVHDDPCASAFVAAITESDGGDSVPTELTCEQAGLNEAVDIVIQDVLGKRTTCFNIPIEVEDITEPVADCVAADTYIIDIQANGLAVIDEDEVSLASSDGCGGGSIDVQILNEQQQSIDQYGCDHVGLNPVTVRVSGTTNVDTCQTSIRVRDPNAVCDAVPGPGPNPNPDPPASGPEYQDVCTGCVAVSPYLYFAKNTVGAQPGEEVDAQALTTADPELESTEVDFRVAEGEKKYHFWGIFSETDEEVHEIRFVLGQKQKTRKKRVAGTISAFSRETSTKKPEKGFKYDKITGPLPFKITREDYVRVIEETELKTKEPFIYTWQPDAPFKASAIKYTSSKDLLLRNVIVVIKKKVPTFSADLCADASLKIPIAASTNDKGADHRQLYDNNVLTTTEFANGDMQHVLLSDTAAHYCSVSFSMTARAEGEKGFYQLAVAGNDDQYHILEAGYRDSIPATWTFDRPFVGKAVRLWLASSIHVDASEVIASVFNPNQATMPDNADCNPITPMTGFASSNGVTNQNGGAFKNPQRAFDGRTQSTWFAETSRRARSHPFLTFAPVWYAQLAPNDVLLCGLTIRVADSPTVEIWTYSGPTPGDGEGYEYARTVTVTNGEDMEISDFHVKASGLMLRGVSPEQGGTAKLSVSEVAVSAFMAKPITCTGLTTRTTLTTPLAWDASSELPGFEASNAFDGDTSTVFVAEGGAATSSLTAYITKVDSSFCSDATDRNSMKVIFPQDNAESTFTVEFSVLSGYADNAGEVADHTDGYWLLLNTMEVTLSASATTSVQIPDFFGRAIRISQLGSLRIASLENFPLAFAPSDVSIATCDTSADSTTVTRIDGFTDAENTNTPASNAFDGDNGSHWTAAASVENPSFWFTFPEVDVCSLSIKLRKPVDGQQRLFVYVAENGADHSGDVNGQKFRLIDALLIPQVAAPRTKVDIEIPLGYRTSGIRLDTTMSNVRIFEVAFETNEGTIGFPTAKAFIQHAIPKTRKLAAVEGNRSMNNVIESSNTQTTVHSWSTSLLSLGGVMAIFGIVWVGLTFTRKHTLKNLDHDSDDDEGVVSDFVNQNDMYGKLRPVYPLTQVSVDLVL